MSLINGHRAIGTGTSALLAVCAFLAGCQSDKDPYSFGSMSRDLTPNMQTSNQRPVDVKADLALTNNMNLRSAGDDLGRTFYTDQPSDLTPQPVVRGTNNQAR